MTNRFMMSVAAAALIAGSGFAFAQGAGGAGGAGGGAAGGGAGGGGPPTTQQNPAPSGGAMNRDSGGAPGMNTTQSKEGMGKDGTKDRAQSKDGMSKDGTKDSAQSKDGMTKDSTKDSAQSKDGVKKDGGTAAKDGKSTTTTGNAATSATTAPPPEKRTQIVSAIKSETSIKETTNVNFNISVGATVPSTVRFHPLPPRIVEIYPEWRGYQVILVNGRYVIVRPQTHEIVYIIEG
jgi:hypothetical protein